MLELTPAQRMILAHTPNIAPMSTPAIAKQAGFKTHAANCVLRRLAQRQLVAKTRGGWPGRPAEWRRTDEGFLTLAAYPEGGPAND